MNSTPDYKLVVEWIVLNLTHPIVREAWIYGSFLDSPSAANDIDVVVQYTDGQAKTVAGLRCRLEHRFKDQFALPLHISFLSETEFREEAEFISMLLGSAKRLL